jgi:hypothetical protein
MMPDPECTRDAPITTKLPVTWAVKSPKRATKLAVSTNPATKLRTGGSQRVQDSGRALLDVNALVRFSLEGGTKALIVYRDPVAQTRHDGGYAA